MRLHFCQQALVPQRRRHVRREGLVRRNDVGGSGNAGLRVLHFARSRRSNLHEPDGPQLVRLYLVSLAAVTRFADQEELRSLFVARPSTFTRPPASIPAPRASTATTRTTSARLA